MVTLLERLSADPTGKGSAPGPVRNRGKRSFSTPYERPGQSKADSDMVWKHDKYNGPGKTLGSRLSDNATLENDTPRVDFSKAVKAVRQAAGVETKGISIKGASSGTLRSNVVHVDNLTQGTTPADVEAIFKRCGAILSSEPSESETGKVAVRLTFKNAADAAKAMHDFNGRSADGETLSVSIIGSASTALGGRMGLFSPGNTVDILMDDDADGAKGSKMRSDELLSDPRAKVLTIPPGVDPKEYNSGRTGPWRGRGRGRGRGKPRSGARMQVD